MSRVGKHAVVVPSGVDVAVSGQLVTVKGQRGELSATLPPEVRVAIEDGNVRVRPCNESARARAMWGTSRSMVNNMVTGVSGGFRIDLVITGVGYRAATDGKALTLQLGYSHDIHYPIPKGIEIKCERPTMVSVSGADRQRVGQVAAEIRAFRKPEPYKGKGIRYADERIRRKEGKKK
ncbi:MAG: 50S ribosomal protein L6 [Alphaproteobacteria bacterium]